MSKVFEYVVFLDEAETEPGVAKTNGNRAKVIVPVTTVVAKDAQAATLVAARSIPEEHMEELERVQVAVRPF